MAQNMPIFFVARTDIGSDAGLQRSFGAFDDVAAAVRHRDQVSGHMQGTFKLFVGVPVLDDGTPETTQTQED